MSDPKTATKAPAQTAPAPKSDTYSGSVVLETGAFDVNKPVMLDEAEQLFRQQLSEVNGAATVQEVRLIKVNHRVGFSAEYHFEAKFIKDKD